MLALVMQNVFMLAKEHTTADKQAFANKVPNQRGLDDVMQEAKQAAYAASPEDPRLEQSSAEIKRVEDSLAALEKQIAQVVAEIADLRKLGATKARRDEIAELRRKEEQLWREKEQLRKKEEQLRKKEEQLREERLIVMRQANT